MTDQTPTDQGEVPNKKRRRGPEPKPPEELRTNRIALRLTDAELATIQRRAGTDSPKQVADFIRRLATGKRLPARIPEINREAWSQLARSAANLNQIAKAINTSGDVDVAQVQRQLASFRLALIGAHDQEATDEGED